MSSIIMTRMQCIVKEKGDANQLQLCLEMELRPGCGVYNVVATPTASTQAEPNGKMNTQVLWKFRTHVNLVLLLFCSLLIEFTWNSFSSCAYTCLRTGC
jgi:hypothetical protein